MNTLLSKLLMGLVAAGAGGYGIYTAVKKEETIFEALTKKDFAFINTSGTADDGEWNSKVEAYKTKQTTDPVLDGYTEKADGNDGDNKEANRSQMKKICKDLVQAPSKDASKLAQAEKWCTKSKK